jgi:hypothetical protein
MYYTIFAFMAPLIVYAPSPAARNLGIGIVAVAFVSYLIVSDSPVHVKSAEVA